jgi:glutathione peroxidase
MATFFDIPVQRIDGTPDLLGPLRGKVVLAVNVASRCGLTPQYADLEALHRELRDSNFSVVGFPCNQFGAQEPGTEQQIAQFCSTTYGVSFPLSSKLDVNGANRHPLYRFLTAPETGVAGDIDGISRSS